ncbi:MAG: ShlB/FhaC/HecB family hemolysin secretion/activation protein [Pseudomonadota bacterium]
MRAAPVRARRRWLPASLAWSLFLALGAGLPARAQDAYVLPPLPADPAGVASPGGATGAAMPARVRIARIEVRGNTVLPAAAFDALAAPYLGRVSSVEELETLRQAMTRLYTEQGYVNSGLLLPDEIVDGIVVMTAVEGRLADVRLRGSERLDPRYISRRLGGADGEVLNVELLRERFQLLLADPLFIRLNARMMPGERAGEAVLDVDVERARPWQLGLFANNYRPVAIGAQALGVSAAVRNLSGQGDALDASVQGSPEGGHGARVTLGWRMPLGQDGTGLYVALDGGSSSVIEEATRALDIRSRLASAEIGLEHRLWETLRSKLAASAGVLRRENRTWLLGQPYSFVPGEPEGHTRETVWRASIDYARRSASDVLALRATVNLGRNNLRQIDGLPETRVPERRFLVWQGQAQYGHQVFDNGAQLVLRGALQYSADSLLALDALAIGGVGSVRGYRENQLVRDRGAYVNAQFEYPLAGEAGGAPVWTLIPFIDYGRAQNVGETGVTLSSVGLAGRWQWRGLNFDIAWAGRLRHPDALGGGANLQDRGMHLQLAYKF